MFSKNNESRTRNTIRNTLFGVLGQFIILVISFLSRSIFIDRLGEEFLGVNGLYTNILTILSLSELGVGNVLLYSLYLPIANNETHKVASYIHFFKKIYKVIAILIFILGVLFIPFLQYVLNSSIDMQNLIIYYILFLLNTVFSYLFIYKSILLEANQNKYVYSIVNLLVNIARNILQILVLIITKSFVLYLLCQIIATVMQNVIMSIICNKIYPLENTTDVLSDEEKHKIINKIKSTFVYKIGTVIMNSTDNVLISIIISTSMVGLYSNYTLIISSVTAFVAVLNTSLFSSIGNLIAEKNQKKLSQNFYFLVYFYQGLISFFAITMFICLNDFITLWIGDSFVLKEYEVFIICFQFYLTNVCSPMWMFREASGLFEQVKYLMIIAAILNLITSFVFGELFGLAGIVGATIFARVVTIFWIEPQLLHKKLLHSPVHKYWIMQIKYFAYTVLVFLCTCYVSRLFIGNLLSLFVRVIFTFILTTLFFVVLNKKDENVKLLLARLRHNV